MSTYTKQLDITKKKRKIEINLASLTGSVMIYRYFEPDSNVPKENHCGLKESKLHWKGFYNSLCLTMMFHLKDFDNQHFLPNLF